MKNRHVICEILTQESHRASGDDNLQLQEGERYFIPVAGGIMEAEDESATDESAVPGGAPIIIEDVFNQHHKRLANMQSRGARSDSEDSGFW